MHDYEQLATLSAILRLGSFDAAAAALSITAPAVSQRVRALEERMGCVLIERGQPARATPTGARLARHFEAVQLMELDLNSDLGRSGSAMPMMRIAVNADSLATWVLPALAKVDGISFDLVIDDQDHSTELLRRGEVLAAVTANARPVQGCEIRSLGALRYIATATPDFFRRWFGEGVCAQSLQSAPALAFDRKDQLQGIWASRQCGQPLSLRGHRIGSSEGFVSATLLGLGWALNPEPLVREHILAGRLVEIIPDRPLDIALHWQWVRLNAGAMTQLTRAIRSAARDHLIQPK